MSAVSTVPTVPCPEAANVPDATLKIVAANAVRHLLEADQHYKAGRYPSATSSAIFSIEETGKLAFLLCSGSMPKKGDKHAWSSILFIALAGVAGSWGWSSEWQPILKGKADTDNLALTDRQQQDAAKYPEVADFVRRVQAGELTDPQERVAAWAAAFTAKELQEGISKKWEPYLKRGLQVLRLQATYAAVATDGTVSDPATVDPAVPHGLCFGATCYASLILVLLHAARPSIDITTLGDISDDVIGMDFVKKFCDALVAAKTREAESASGRAA